MIHHPAESTLYALVDGELDADAASRVEMHVAACEQCAALVTRAERLTRAAAAAPRMIDPPPSVLAGVRAAMAERGREAGVPTPGGTQSWARPGAPASSPYRRGAWIAAAGIAAVALGITSFAVGRSSQQGAPEPQLTRATAIASGSTILGELLRELETRRPLLAPQTISVVEEQLRMIDEAIAATEDALASDPANPHLDRMLQHARRQREDYLRTTLSLAATL